MSSKNIIFFLLFLVNTLLAGPPFRTDDPVPVDYGHGEVYLFSNSTIDNGGYKGVGAGFEFNYGILPSTQFHFVMPMAANAPNNAPSHFGMGDLEFGIKYRFFDQSSYLPMVGIFPFLEVPTGNASYGLGNGKPQLYLPIWLQKDISKWTFYGGGGYWLNPGVGNLNWQFYGLLAQYNLTNTFFLGSELIYNTKPTIDGQDNLGLHIGGGIPIKQNYQILFSFEAGNGLGAYKHFSYYFGLYHTF